MDDDAKSEMVEITKSRYDQLLAGEAAMIEFVDRVDRGEVRSTKTYSKFKKILEQ